MRATIALALSITACGSSEAPLSPHTGGGGVSGSAGSLAAGATAGGGATSVGAAGSTTGGVAAAGSAGAVTGGAGSEAGGGAGVAGSQGGTSLGYEPIAGDEYDELPLYAGEPPNLKADAPAETLNAQGHIGNVSVPTLRRYTMDAAKATGYGYLVFPGGGYFILDMETHAAALAARVGPQGVAVFALKYRVGEGTTDAPRDALLDAKRAVRLVKENASRWGVAVPQLGIIGYSAGSHLALSLAASFDSGDASAADTIERQSSRPAFVGSMATWAFGSKTSPFAFTSDVPATFFCHAEDDDGAPIDLPKAVEAQIKAHGAATFLDFYPTGGHSTCHPGDSSVAGHDWPDKFWPWVQGIPL
jgi:predicted esterase